MCELDVTAIVASIAPRDYSASVAELGNRNHRHRSPPPIGLKALAVEHEHGQANDGGGVADAVDDRQNHLARLRRRSEHHLVPELEMLQRLIAERLGYRLVDHRMELYGVSLDRKTADAASPATEPQGGGA